MRGRKPRPTALRVIDGNPGKRRINRDEPNAGPLGDPPPDLSPAAVAKWAEMAELWGLVVTAADRDQLAEYCRLHVRKIEAEAKVVEHGALVASPNGMPIQSPWMQILNKCREEMRRIAIEFGGTPVSRTRLSVEGGREAKSKFAGLIGRAGSSPLSSA